MPITLNPSNDVNRAREESSFMITINFTDRNGQPVTPKTGTWTLTDENGTIINSRDAEDISGLDTSVEIVLSGNDLAISADFTGVSEKRIFTVKATYDSDLANDLPLNESLIFYVDNLVAIT